MWSLRRRIEIVGIILAAIAIFIVFPYWLTHREVPSCFDNKQNQGEEGVDCGSPCALLCRGKAKDLNLLWTKVFPIRPGFYDVVAYVENPNFNVSAPKFSYTAKLYDADGTVIATKEGDTFALPSERFAIFAGGLSTGAKEAKSGSLEIHPGVEWFATQKTETLFSISDKVLSGSDKMPKLTAQLHNETAHLYRNIDVTAVLYDSKGAPIAVSSTKVEKLDPQGVENLFFTWPSPFNFVAETEQCETPVDVVLALDRSGSMREDDKIGQAKQAATQFVERLTANDQGAYVSFATDASNPIDQPLTNEVDRLRRAIAKTEIGSDGLQYTNIGDSFRRAIDELHTFRRNQSARPVVVLLTDGIPTMPKDPKNKDYPSQYAEAVADEAKKDNITMYTIGLGADVNESLLQHIATSPEYYYKAASGAELSSVYAQISSSICKKGPSVIEIIPRVNSADSAQ